MHVPAVITASLLAFAVASASGAVSADLQRQFTATVQPFMESYCFSCHGKEKPKAELDLTTFTTLEAVVSDFPRWQQVLERLESGEMPPAKAKDQPDDEKVDRVVHWIESALKAEAEKNAGDPGVVLARRLSNAEYDYTIRDLTGVDIRPTKEFPVDPANQSGFDNSGESLAMSPALFKKYLTAARQVADHVVLKADGLVFAPHPMAVETDRDKYCIRQIIDFYERQPTDYADYFQASWRYKHRAALGKAQATLADVARESGVSANYLGLIWPLLSGPRETVGPIARLQEMWAGLPAPVGAEPAAIRQQCERMRDYVVDIRGRLEWKFRNLELKGFSAGGQAFIGWKNRQYAAHRRKLNPERLQVAGDPRFSPEAIQKALADSVGRKEPDPLSFDVSTNEPVILPVTDLTIPFEESARGPYIAAFEKFCDVFPDAFYISERGRMNLDRPKDKQDKGRLLSAGFHNMMGYFRDDGPLYELILDENGRKELDQLWLEFDMIAQVPERQHVEFIFYERAESRTIKGPEFDFARSEDKDITTDAKIRQLADVYLAKARESLRTNGGDPMVIEVIEDHFEITAAHIRRTEKSRVEVEPSHLKALTDFAARAYRRPMTPRERDDLLAFYRSLRAESELTHEEAVRDSIVSVLMSPYFLYRVDLADKAAEMRSAADDGRSRVAPLSDHALANRLSYFLWSSMPDAELMRHAAAGDLRKPEVLIGQARRMLQDDRARGLAVEFAGNWLDFRRFEEHNAVDRERFPEFNNDLRSAMFEEPIRFVLDVVRKDRSILDFLYAKDTFVNRALADHYGIEGVASGNSEWVHVADASAFGRGGLLPMSVFLTRNAPGLRTSPVKRGYWVVRRVLGEQIPPPPAVVPELPHDEAKLDLPLREVLARHREDPGCAGCHARFDSFGLVFEGYGPVGERREKDLAGRPVDIAAEFPGGTIGAGLDGLRDYVREKRQDDFIDNLCRKMMVYALGRSLILSDDPTIRDMRGRLGGADYRFSALVESIITSPQFLNKRTENVLARKGD